MERRGHLGGGILDACAGRRRLLVKGQVVIQKIGLVNVEMHGVNIACAGMGDFWEPFFVL